MLVVNSEQIMNRNRADRIRRPSIIFSVGLVVCTTYTLLPVVTSQASHQLYQRSDVYVAYHQGTCDLEPGYKHEVNPLPLSHTPVILTGKAASS